MDPIPGLAFSAGILAIVNPCALGMIPAYLQEWEDLPPGSPQTASNRTRSGTETARATFVPVQVPTGEPFWAVRTSRAGLPRPTVLVR